MIQSRTRQSWIYQTLIDGPSSSSIASKSPLMTRKRALTPLRVTPQFTASFTSHHYRHRQPPQRILGSYPLVIWTCLSFRAERGSRSLSFSHHFRAREVARVYTTPSSSTTTTTLRHTSSQLRIPMKLLTTCETTVTWLFCEACPNSESFALIPR